MRLLVVTNDYPPKPGGIQQYLGNLVDAYPHPVRVIGPADGPATGTAKGEDVVRRHRRRFMWPTRGVAAFIRREAADFQPDAVLFGAPYPLTLLGPRLGAALDVPVGVLCHGAEVVFPAALPGTRQLLGRTLRRFDARFAVSRFTRDRVARLTGRPVHYVGAGVDLAAYAPAPAPHPHEPPVVGCVSRFVPRKGQHRLIAAATELRRRGLAVTLLMVGKGRTEPRLRRLADRSGVPVRFEVDVPWERLGDLYREMDAFCMPCRSRWGGLEVEGLGLVFLEAAASGLPVLAGDSGGAPETVAPGETGFVVRSVADIADGLEYLLDDPGRAAAMGHAGRERVEHEFAWARVVERLLAGLSAT